MRKFLVSNIGDRDHKTIFGKLGQGAIFDLAPFQHGWDDYSKIEEGDIVYIINKKRKIEYSYQVATVKNNICLANDDIWSDEVHSDSGGEIRVIFGDILQLLDTDYSEFVLQNKIISPKINPATGKMYPGFNCTQFI